MTYHLSLDERHQIHQQLKQGIWRSSDCLNPEQLKSARIIYFDDDGYHRIELR